MENGLTGLYHIFQYPPHVLYDVQSGPVGHGGRIGNTLLYTSDSVSGTVASVILYILSDSLAFRISVVVAHFSHYELHNRNADRELRFGLAREGR